MDVTIAQHVLSFVVTAYQTDTRKVWIVAVLIANQPQLIVDGIMNGNEIGIDCGGAILVLLLEIVQADFKMVTKSTSIVAVLPAQSA